MTKVNLTARKSNLRRVNLSQFVAFFSRYPNGARLQMAALPSEAFLNSDGTLSVSSRTGLSEIKRTPMVAKVFFGVTRDTNELVEITFN